MNTLLKIAKFLKGFNVVILLTNIGLLAFAVYTQNIKVLVIGLICSFMAMLGYESADKVIKIINKRTKP
jgi:hypothetical protein